MAICLPNEERSMIMRAEKTSGAERLIPALEHVAFVSEPAAIDRFEVRILPNGTIYFKGSRERIAEFLQACAAEGLETHVDHVALCG